jgi:hypothetical protein
MFVTLGQLSRHRLLHIPQRLLASQLLRVSDRLCEERQGRLADGGLEIRVGGRHPKLAPRPARHLHEPVLDLDDAADFRVGNVERRQHLLLGDLLRAGLDHDDRVRRPGHNQIEPALLLNLPHGGVEDELIVDEAHAHRADRSIKRQSRDHQGR